MNNYEHEIECPENNAITCYLWNDYFHDSKVNNIAFDNKKHIVRLTLISCKDSDAMWDKLAGDWEAKHKYLSEHEDELTYNLTFKGVVYLHLERMPGCNDYINGRFKDTALLKKFITEINKPLYHFRIQFDDGYCDIIFRDFIIRKLKGRVSYYPIKCMMQTEEAVSLDTANIVSEAIRGDDIDRFTAMELMWRYKHPDLLEVARNNILLNGEYIFTAVFSAYILGKFGDKTDLPVLYKKHSTIERDIVSQSICPSSTLLPKRNILDAIEEIHFRCTIT